MRKPIRLITAREIKEYYSMKQAIDSIEREFFCCHLEKIYVDHMESCRKESGDFIKPMTEVIIQKVTSLAKSEIFA